MKKSIEAIENLLAEDQKELLKSIYAPKVVGVPLSDSRRSICVLPTGEIRSYGKIGADICKREEGRHAYLSSFDGGMSWQTRYATGKMRSATYFEDFGLYIGFPEGVDGDYGDKVYIYRSKIGPGDENPELIHVSDIDTLNGCNFLPIKSEFSDRIWFTGERNTKNKEALFFYSDDMGITWHTREIPTPLNESITFPDVGRRWSYYNNTEPYVGELGENHLYMIIRTAHDSFYESHSYDNGDTWSEPVPSTFYGTNTTAFILRLTDGRVLTFWNNTNALPIPVAGADPNGEINFNNRDAAHVAITDDGVNYKGYRELILNPIRNANDFRYSGDDMRTRDKSVHQFQAIELPYNKVLVSAGQHEASGRLIIFDVDWLYENEREYKFIDGLAPLTAHTYVKSVRGSYVDIIGKGHCSYNRTYSAMMLLNPEDDRYEILSVSKHEDNRLYSSIGGFGWNFPMAKSGKISIEMKILEREATVCLADRWYNPSEKYLSHRTNFWFELDSSLYGTDFMTIDIEYDTEKEKAKVYKNGEFIFDVKMQKNCPTGISYLIMQCATDGDSEGFLIKNIKKV